MEEIQLTALQALSWLLIKWKEQTLGGLIINPMLQGPLVHPHNSFPFLLPAYQNYKTFLFRSGLQGYSSSRVNLSVPQILDETSFWFGFAKFEQNAQVQAEIVYSTFKTQLLTCG